MSDAPRRVLVANRGEIALRVIRAAHALGWEAVAVHSRADAASRWVALADEAVDIGPSQATKSYLDTEKVLAAAKDTRCGFVHPATGSSPSGPRSRTPSRRPG